jgi:single-strand DNA-binding protein
MRDKNEVSLRGRLGNAPKYVAGAEGNQSRASLSVCTNYTYVTKDGTEKSRSEWHDVVIWGKAADNAAKYLVTGLQVEVSGRLQRREYEAKDGTTRRVTEVVATQIEYGTKPKAATNESAVKAAGPVVASRQQTSVRRRATEPTIEIEAEDGADPF